MSFDTQDIQDKFIALLNADPTIQSLFVTSGNDPAFNPVLDDDPTSVDQTTNALLAMVLMQEDESDATLGGNTIGRLKTVATFAFCVYLWDDHRDEAKKRQINRMSSQLRRAIMRYRVVNNDQGEQLWNLTKFRKPTTTYFTTGGFRESVTLLDVYSEQR